jgi:hypothetical protein
MHPKPTPNALPYDIRMGISGFALIGLSALVYLLSALTPDGPLPIESRSAHEPLYAAVIDRRW